MIRPILNPDRSIVYFITMIFCLFFMSAKGQTPPKREFRGVWIATVVNIDWPTRQDLTPEKQREEFRTILNHHQRNGMNAVIVQVRPSADALYRSDYEPWSEWLTGEQGQSPQPEYDPLTFMIEEAHERGMEFHAWLNPYRAVFSAEKFYRDSTHLHLDTLKKVINELIVNDSSNTTGRLTTKQHRDLLLLMELDTTLLVYRHPEWFLQYGDKIYFDPGVPEVRKHITRVVGDIVSRYDVDAIHMDDYFYPYKIAGIEFPDSVSFGKYGGRFSESEMDDWRRENVNIIVKMLHDTIRAVKPWVKFGISPFGVWRNASVDPAGSDTKAGQTNYDDLYADVLKWMEEKWIDYVIPQIYWYRGFKLADYNVLAHWWNDNNYDVPVYIGHGMYRVNGRSKSEAWRNPDEIPAQIDLIRTLPNLQGSCFFSSKSMVNNPLGVVEILRNTYYRYPALVPRMSWLEGKILATPEIKEIRNSPAGIVLDWNIDKNAAYYIIYRFRGRKAGDIDDATNVLAIVHRTTPFYTDATARPGLFRKYTYLITALDRLWNESAKSTPKTIKPKKVK